MSNTLKLAPDNVYLGVKQLSAYVVAAEMFSSLAITVDSKSGSAEAQTLNVEDGEGIGHMYEANYDNTLLRKTQTNRYTLEAIKILNAIKRANRKYGYVPLSLDESFPGWDQYSVVLGEGLMYLGLGGNDSKITQELASIIKNTYIKALEKSTTPYGIRLTSDEPVTWF